LVLGATRPCVGRAKISCLSRTLQRRPCLVSFKRRSRFAGYAVRARARGADLARPALCSRIARSSNGSGEPLNKWPGGFRRAYWKARFPRSFLILRECQPLHRHCSAHSHRPNADGQMLSHSRFGRTRGLPGQLQFLRANGLSEPRKQRFR